MRNEKGQLWSLDVVLAAVLFTLALGLILSQTELQQYYGQQDREARGLQSSAIQASNAIVSRAAQLAASTYLPCVTGNNCGVLVNADPNAPVNNTNVRCGPNEKYYQGAKRVGPLITVITFNKLFAWQLDNDTSWMENCMIDDDMIFRSNRVGVQKEYVVDLNAHLFGGGYTHYHPVSPGPTDAYYTVTRKMVFSPTQSDANANMLRLCMDGGCAKYITDVNILVWRS